MALVQFLVTAAPRHRKDKFVWQEQNAYWD